MMLHRLSGVWKVVTVAVLASGIAACGGGGEEPVTEQAPAEQEQVQPTRQPAVTPERTAPTPEAPPEPPVSRPQIVREPGASPYGFYTIQLSSWKTLRKAEQEAERYREMGLEAYVQRAEIAERGVWYRVRVGNYPSLSEARRAAASLVGVDVEDLWVDNFRRKVPPA